MLKFKTLISFNLIYHPVSAIPAWRKKKTKKTSNR